MSVLHGYCIRAAGDPRPPDDLSGIGDAEVRLLEEAGVGLWFSLLERRPEVKVEALRAHDRVIRAALRFATPLPLRFGSPLADEAAAAAMLRERSEEFRATLSEIGSRVEMGVQVARHAGAGNSTGAGESALGGKSGSVASRRSPPARPAITSGRDYLEARRREIEAADRDRAEAERALDRVEAGLADMGLRSHRKVQPHGDTLGLVAHLVQRNEIRSYRERVLELRTVLPELQLSISGPWAPYSFV